MYGKLTALLLASTLSWTPNSSANSAHASLMIEAVGVTAAMPITCGDDDDCGVGATKHTLPPGGTEYAAPHEDCIEPANHGGPGCSAAFYLRDVIGPKALSYEVLLAAERTNVILNSDRRALQLMGCGGDILANIPLTETEYQALSD